MSTAPVAELGSHIDASIQRLVAFLQSGEADGLFAPDVFADVTVPHWRVQVEGAAELIAVRAHMHPYPGLVRVEKAMSGDSGYAVKLEERWEDGGQQWYCREAFLCDLDDEGRVTEFHVYCTGDWDEALVAQHRQTVTLVRP